jgi:hypothetical protein
MSDQQGEDVIYSTNLGPLPIRQGYDEGDGAHHVRPAARAALAPAEVHKKLNKAIEQITSNLNLLPNQDGQFAVEEVEFDLAIDTKGKINVLFADVGGGIRHTVRVRWKRRCSE